MRGLSSNSSEPIGVMLPVALKKPRPVKAISSVVRFLGSIPVSTLVNRISVTDLLTRIGYSIDKQTDVVVKKLSAVMNMLGWELKRSSLQGRPWQYARPDTGADQARSSDSNGSTPATQGEQQERAEDGCPF